MGLFKSPLPPEPLDGYDNLLAVPIGKRVKHISVIGTDSYEAVQVVLEDIPPQPTAILGSVTIQR